MYHKHLDASLFSSGFPSWIKGGGEEGSDRKQKSGRDRERVEKK